MLQHTEQISYEALSLLTIIQKYSLIILLCSSFTMESMGRHPHTVLSPMPESDKDSSQHRGRFKESSAVILKTTLRKSILHCYFFHQNKQAFQGGVQREMWLHLYYMDLVPLLQSSTRKPGSHSETKAQCVDGLFPLTSEEMSCIKYHREYF